MGVWWAGKPAEEASVPSAAATDTATLAASSMVGIDQLEAALEASPDDVDLLLELGASLFNANRAEEAKAHWERATRIEPTAAQAWYYLGFYWLSTEPPDFDQARAAWETVLDLEPESDLASAVQTHITGLLETASPAPPEAG
jgi:Flp pilus assembly protein TadD